MLVLFTDLLPATGKKKREKGSLCQLMLVVSVLCWPFLGRKGNTLPAFVVFRSQSVRFPTFEHIYIGLMHFKLTPRLTYENAFMGILSTMNSVRELVYNEPTARTMDDGTTISVFF
jgi:hypothetical protein